MVYVLRQTTLMYLDIYSYCWFASEVTAPMLVVKNKSISLRWEMNFILKQI